MSRHAEATHGNIEELPRRVPVVSEADVCVVGGGCSGVFPGFWAGADDLNDFVYGHNDLLYHLNKRKNVKRRLTICLS